MIWWHALVALMAVNVRTATLVTFCPLTRRGIVCQKYAMGTGTIVCLAGGIELGSGGRRKRHFWLGPRYWKPI